MASHGAIDLLVDASHLEGWDSLAALDKHVAFLKARQSKVDHVAVITRPRQAGEGETVSSVGGEPFEDLVADIADGR